VTKVGRMPSLTSGLAPLLTGWAAATRELAYATSALAARRLLTRLMGAAVANLLRDPATASSSRPRFGTAFSARSRISRAPVLPPGDGGPGYTPARGRHESRATVVVLVGVVLASLGSPPLAQTPTFTWTLRPSCCQELLAVPPAHEVAPMPLDLRACAVGAVDQGEGAQEGNAAVRRPVDADVRNDRQMSEKEIYTLVSWVDAGAPKGNDADLPAPPAYPGGWKFNREPDVVLKMPVEFRIEPRSEYPMLDFYVPIPWTDGMKLIQMSEARPSNKAVVHHITVSLVTFPPCTEVMDGQPFTTDASGKKVPLDRRTARIEQRLPTELQTLREPAGKPIA
jgi:hypothetical protein